MFLRLMDLDIVADVTNKRNYNVSSDERGEQAELSDTNSYSFISRKSYSRLETVHWPRAKSK